MHVAVLRSVHRGTYYDDTVFSRLLSFELRLLPAQGDRDYNLRPRSHNLSLSCTMDHRNFIHILAFKTPTNTRDRPLSVRNNCFNPTPSYYFSSILKLRFVNFCTNRA